MGTVNDSAVARIRGCSATRGRPVGVFSRIGDHILFYGKALAATPHAAAHFRQEIIRLIAEISMGAGTLAMIGGTVVIVGFLTLATGGTLAVQGYSSLGNIGIEALTGFLAAFINVRISAPVVAGIGLAATFGAGVTAQLGAMRINEEIDALESMGIRPIEYLVSHPDRGGHDRDHAAVLDRGDPVVRGLASSPPWCCSASPAACTTTTSTRSSTRSTCCGRSCRPC